ncbi:MAG: XdhC family protein [Gemmatimonadetes bacterium]|nr:XdhC family protein [Gemmatimonadota bacterium]
MTELDSLITAIAECKTGSPVLATLMKVAGSAYRGAGARMLIRPDGTLVGAVSGGCLEKDLAAHSEQVRAAGCPKVVSYDLTQDDDAPWGLGMGCHAVLDVLLEPLAAGEPPAHLDFIAAQLERREPAVVATLFRAPPAAAVPVGARLMMSADGRVQGDLVGGALGGSVRTDAARVLREERSDAVSYRIEGGEAEALIEFVPQPVALVACGDGNDAPPLAALAGALGWQARIVRKDDPLGPLDDRTAVVLMTHNYARDLALLEALLPSRARYIGVLGPHSRTEQLLDDLRGSGHAPNDVRLARVHAPVGLDIGAETPAEVALSIVAEIRAVFAGRQGGALRSREGPIHDRR